MIFCVSSFILFLEPMVREQLNGNDFGHCYVFFFRKYRPETAWSGYVLVLELWQFLFYKGLTRNSKIENTPVWVWFNIWRLGRVSNTKFGTNVSNKMLLNAAKCRFFVIKGKPTGRGFTPPTLPHPD